MEDKFKFIYLQHTIFGNVHKIFSRKRTFYVDRKTSQQHYSKK